NPRWLGVGATEDYLAFLTFHTPTMPCARCLHPAGPVTNGPVPTAAFVSHWGGLALATAFARMRSNSGLPAGQQLTQIPSLQLGSSNSIWRLPGIAQKECPGGCGVTAVAVPV